MMTWHTVGYDVDCLHVESNRAMTLRAGTTLVLWGVPGRGRKILWLLNAGAWDAG
jgi:hypothetical protein